MGRSLPMLTSQLSLFVTLTPHFSLLMLLSQLTTREGFPSDLSTGCLLVRFSDFVELYLVRLTGMFQLIFSSTVMLRSSSVLMRPAAKAEQAAAAAAAPVYEEPVEDAVEEEPVFEAGAFEATPAAADAGWDGAAVQAASEW